MLDFTFGGQALQHGFIYPLASFDSYDTHKLDLVFEVFTDDDGVIKINSLLQEGVALVFGDLVVKRLDGNLGSFQHAYCLSPQQKSETLVLKDRKALDHGFNQKVKVKKQSLLSWSMAMFTIACACISMGIVLGIRKRRNLFNVSVLRESNQRLDGLIWVLNYSMNFFQEEDEKETSRRGLTSAAKKKLLGFKNNLNLPDHQINT
mmetsp:Transcript_20696/g.31701  ORF Transcript_20696/g.31701 Transcript_20696/m.31701 type:complete len:205 (-) Transcript_20696:1045-1659(-)